LGTLRLIVLIQRFFKGFIASIAVLIGLLVGTTAEFILGDAHFGDMAAQPWVGVTTPFYFGWPKFRLAAIISMLVVLPITAVETPAAFMRPARSSESDQEGRYSAGAAGGRPGHHHRWRLEFVPLHLLFGECWIGPAQLR